MGALSTLQGRAGGDATAAVRVGTCRGRHCGVNGEASNKSKLKTLYLNSLPFPFLPAWSDPDASPGPAPAQPQQSSPGARCAPHPWAAASLPRSDRTAKGPRMSNPLLRHRRTEQRGPLTIGVPLRRREHRVPQSLPGQPGAAVICACQRSTSCWDSSHPRSAL